MRPRANKPYDHYDQRQHQTTGHFVGAQASSLILLLWNWKVVVIREAKFDVRTLELRRKLRKRV
jgi:hypothetical protein